MSRAGQRTVHDRLTVHDMAWLAGWLVVVVVECGKAGTFIDSSTQKRPVARH